MLMWSVVPDILFLNFHCLWASLSLITAAVSLASGERGQERGLMLHMGSTAVGYRLGGWPSLASLAPFSAQHPLQRCPALQIQPLKLLTLWSLLSQKRSREDWQKYLIQTDWLLCLEVIQLSDSTFKNLENIWIPQCSKIFMILYIAFVNSLIQTRIKHHYMSAMLSNKAITSAYWIPTMCHKLSDTLDWSSRLIFPTTLWVKLSSLG